MDYCDSGRWAWIPTREALFTASCSPNGERDVGKQMSVMGEIFDWFVGTSNFLAIIKTAIIFVRIYSTRIQ